MNTPNKCNVRVRISGLLLAVLFSCSTVNTLRAASPDFLEIEASVADWGASGNDSTDDTVAINNAINWCKANGYKTLYFPAGTYKISAPLNQLNSGFSMVSITGENTYKTIIDASAIAVGAGETKAALVTAGGSGQFNQAEIRGLTIKGSSGLIGILVKGTGGVRIRDCRFDNLKTGVELSNAISSGTFTEFTIIEDSVFEQGCLTAMKFTRSETNPATGVTSVGSDSFHGSGLRRCTINRANNTVPSIIVGTSSTDAFNLYNASLDFTVWTRSAANIIQVACAASTVSADGTIKVENLGSSSVATLVGGLGRVFFTGEVLSWGEVKFGNLSQVDSFKRNSDGSVNSAARLRRLEVNLTNAVTTVTDCQTGELGSLMSVMLTASNYDFRYLLFIMRDGYGGNGYVKELAIPRSFANYPGLGAPSFSVNTSGQLVVTFTNFPSQATVNMKMGISSMGGRKELFWQ